MIRNDIPGLHANLTVEAGEAQDKNMMESMNDVSQYFIPECFSIAFAHKKEKCPVSLAINKTEQSWPMWCQITIYLKVAENHFVSNERIL